MDVEDSDEVAVAHHDEKVEKSTEERKEEMDLLKLAWIRTAIILVVFVVMIVPGIYLLLEEQRVGSCMEDLIVTTNERDKHTAELRSLADRTDQLSIDFQRDTIELTKLPREQQSPAYIALIKKFNDDAAKLQKEKDAKRAQQDKFKFPSLAECKR